MLAQVSEHHQMSKKGTCVGPCICLDVYVWVHIDVGLEFHHEEGAESGRVKNMIEVKGCEGNGHGHVWRLKHRPLSLTLTHLTIYWFIDAAALEETCLQQ